MSVDKVQRVPRGWRNTPVHPANLHVGTWAWILHRITGLALVGYLLLHICVISSALYGSGSFDVVLGVLQTPFFLVLDLGLLAAVLYHGLNGVRILLFDIGVGVRRQKEIFAATIVLSAAGVLWGFLRVLPEIISR